MSWGSESTIPRFNSGSIDTSRARETLQPHLKMTNDSWRGDEAYIKVKGYWKYLCRALLSLPKSSLIPRSALKMRKLAEALTSILNTRNT